MHAAGYGYWLTSCMVLAQVRQVQVTAQQRPPQQLLQICLQ